MNKGPNQNFYHPTAALSPLALEGLVELWQQTLGDSGITIAVLDGPVDLTHPSLVRAAITQMDFIRSGAADGPAAEHGTHTASVIFGQHDSPVKGIAPLCRGLIIPIFRNTPQGGIAPCSQPDLARAIRAAMNAGAQVINVSAGQFSSRAAAHPMLADAVRECAHEGHLIVAAAGNNGCECLQVPGALPSVLAVGAMDGDGNPVEFSNWGSSYQSMGILAPGVNILGAGPGGGVTHRTGTSFAAPIVSGLVGLLLSLQRKQGQQPNAHAVRAAMLESALGCEHSQVPDCRRLLAGRVNVSGAVSRILKGASKMSDQPPEPAAVQQTIPMQGTAPVRDVPAPEADNRIVRVAEKTATLPPAEALPHLHPRVSSSQDSDCPGGNSMGEPQVAVSVNDESCGGVASATDVAASECSCQNNGERVYAIGDLDVDFGTLARLDSIQQNAETFNSGGRLNVQIRGNLLRHLLGWRETYKKKGEEEKKTDFHEPHMYDAQAVIWVLRQDESPVYAIRPTGAYAEDAYRELAHFLMEQEGYREDRRIPEGELPERIFYPSLDTKNGSEPNRTTNTRGDPVRIVERVAIPGIISGMAELFSGAVVPVICPDMRGTRSWSIPALCELHCNVDPEAEGQELHLKTMRNLERIAQRFFEEVRNPGLAPEDRALNFVATQVFRFVPFLRDKFGEGFDPELDSISVKPSPTCRKDSECYDVETAFFDPESVLRSMMVLARTIDVSDVVPVLLGDEREYRRR